MRVLRLTAVAAGMQAGIAEGTRAENSIRMYTALLILALLVLAASLGSWLFNQWLSDQRRASALALGLGGVGFVLLMGATAMAILSTSANWQAFVPRFGDSIQEKSTSTASVVVADFGSAEQWPATRCIKPMHASDTTPRRWFLDNECDRAVAVMLAWCDETYSVCTAGAPQAAWRYEPAGLVMTSMMARPIARRMPEHDAPITGTYALEEAEGTSLRIRYLACYLSESVADALMHDATSADEFHRVLRADDCYARVSSSSLIGARTGQPPVISTP